jgi:acetoin utilization deacetylase AcuC-like enzyme
MLPIIYSPLYEVDIGVHVFPTSKYRHVRDEVIRRGLVGLDGFLEPPPPEEPDLLRVHTPDFLDDLRQCRWTPRTWASELPLTPEIVQAYLLGASGTLLAARHALDAGGAAHLGGGFHHAFSDHAEGFCYINDIAVAIRALMHEGRIHRPVVVDCDLHQGNGTAAIFQQEPEVFTFSIHQENNYPVKQRSRLDIGLEDFAGDERYLRALDGVIPRVYDRHEADFVVYVAGADPFEEDQLGLLRLSREGLRRRDEKVLAAAVQRQIPFVVVLAGGYARKLEDTVAIHADTVAIAARCLETFSTA